MVKSINDEFVLYDSLTEEEAVSLRQKCIKDILDDDFDPLCPMECINYFMCFNRENTEESFCTDTVIRVIDTLIIKSDAHKIFYGDFKDDEIQEVYNMIINEDPTFEANSVNIHLLAQAFIKVIRCNEKLMLPIKINEELFDSFVNYDLEKQKKIIKRIPFIVNRRNRTFLILMQILSESIEDKQHLNSTSRSDLLHIFGPIVFKGNVKGRELHGYHRMVILEDVLNADLIKVDRDIYNP